MIVVQMLRQGWARQVLFSGCLIAVIAFRSVCWIELPSGRAMRLLIVGTGLTMTRALSTEPNKVIPQTGDRNDR